MNLRIIFATSFFIACVAAKEVDNNYVNPCCSSPCQHGTFCMTKGYDDYQCDCTSLPYYGKNCEIPTWWEYIVSFIRPSADTQHHITTNYKGFWDFINGISYLHDKAMRYVLLARADKVDLPAPYAGMSEYITIDNYFNQSKYVRALPPIPKGCPTEMGTKGPKKLPDPDLIVKTFFTRKQFIPDKMGSNIMFAFFAQHFTHTFFKTDEHKGPEYTWGRHGVDMSNIYGPDIATENKLRSMEGGRLKMQTVNGEQWPMYTSQVDIKQLRWPGIEQKYEFALGHEFFSILPGLAMYSTIWMREHNRVSRLLETEHPDWDDERLFQTAKLVILGQTIKIVIEDYVQHLSGYNFKLTYDPELLHGQPLQYQNRIFLEFNHLYRWHPLMPDSFIINGTDYTLGDFLKNGTEILVKHGMKEFVESFSKQRAGQIGAHNHATYTQRVVKRSIEDERLLRMQSFNDYRRKYRLTPYTSFYELTGDFYLADKLEEMYEDIDAVEYFVGIYLEKRRHGSLFGGTIIDMGGPFSLQGLYANPLGSPKYWKPTTFGGETGFNIVKTATLRKLFCQNMDGESCPYVGYRVPDYEEDADEHQEL